MASVVSGTAAVRHSFLRVTVAQVTGASISRHQCSLQSFSSLAFLPLENRPEKFLFDNRTSCSKSILRRQPCFLHVFQQALPFLSKGESSTCVTSFVVKCMSSDAGESKTSLPARLVQKKQLLDLKTEENSIENEGPIPKISEEHVTVGFARSGGPGGQNVNKVNTKVDMRFNVMAATWLPERIRLKILEKEKNRINGDGELVVSSTRTRTQKGNIEDALQKIQTIIDVASHVPPPPSEEKKKRIDKLAKAENEKRLRGKKELSSKKGDRRNKGSWD